MSTPKEEAEMLMNELLPLAKRMLSEEGEFYPYGGALRSTGEIIQVGAEIEGNDHPNPTSIVKIVKRKLKQEVKGREAIATAIICNMRVVPPGGSESTDAIQVSVDHSSGFSADVFFPYSLDGQSILFAKTFAQRGQAVMFQDSETNF